MITRMRTSKASKERLDSLNRALRFSSNAVVLRYALALSLAINNENPIESDKSAQVMDTSGFEITRATLFGEKEVLYRVIMGFNDGNNDDFFPKLTNMHIERGLRILEHDYKIAGNKDKFIKNLISKL